MSPTDGVIREAWELYRAHWRHLLPISFLVYVTTAIIAALLTAVLTWLGALIAALISLVGLFWVQGALATAVEDIRDGRADLSLGETFSRVRPQLGSIVVAGVLAGIGVSLGLLLLIVPGLVLMTWWVLIIPVTALERASAGAAFGRSRELVRGYGWKVFGVIVLTILLLLGFEVVLAIVLTPLADWLRNSVANVVSGTLTAPFIALVWTLLYFRLRQAKSAPAAAAPSPVTST
ncbi:MAG: hypothetical protein M3304_05055 [Actinomycetota bacterium]|nr:hypothetical protein [Actinomycetota bacterium]